MNNRSAKAHHNPPQNFFLIMVGCCLSVIISISLISCTKELIKTPEPISYLENNLIYSGVLHYALSMDVVGNSTLFEGTITFKYKELIELLDNGLMHTLSILSIETTIEAPLVKDIIAKISQSTVNFTTQKNGLFVSSDPRLKPIIAYIQPILALFYPVFSDQAVKKEDQTPIQLNSTFSYENISFSLKALIHQMVSGITKKKQTILVNFSDTVSAQLTSTANIEGRGNGKRSFTFNFTDGYLVQNHLYMDIDQLEIKTMVGFFGIRANLKGKVVFDLRLIEAGE